MTQAHAILEGDLLSILPTMPDNHFDAVLCDPPYHLTAKSRNGSPQPGDGRKTPFGRYGVRTDKGFMGQTWDGAQRSPSKHGNQSRVGEWGLEQTPHGLPTIALETPEGQRWDGYGTALKPAYEPILLCRKPGEKTYAENALKWGCGALNIDGGRIEVQNETLSGGTDITWSRKRDGKGAPERNGYRHSPEGRWPANVMFDEDAAEILDAQAGIRKSGALEGGASRFFYVSKVSTRERQAGVSEGNDHPTMKPIDLTRQLATLLLPPARPGGEQRRLLVPFSGSGSEMIGALMAGWDDMTGIEQSPEYARIAQQRIAWWTGENIMDPVGSPQAKTACKTVTKKEIITS